MSHALQVTLQVPTRIIFAEKGYQNLLFVAEVAASAFEPDLIEVKSDLRLGKYTECCLSYPQRYCTERWRRPGGGDRDGTHHSFSWTGGKCMACCLRHHGGAFPKNVNAVVATFKTKYISSF